MTAEKTKLVTEFREYYDRFININPNYFYKETLGTLSFKGLLEPIFSGLNDKLSKISTVIEDVPNEIITSLNTFLIETINYLNEIANFSQDQYITNRNEIHRILSVKYDKFMTFWSTISGIYLYASNGDQKQELVDRKQLEDTINSLKKKSESDALEIEKLRKVLESQLNSFEERYKDIYSKAELRKQEKRFMESADFNNKQATFWIFGIIALVLALLIKKNQNWLLIYEVARKSFLRILILSLIIYLIKFAVKNYNALKHNFIINRHKENSLDTALNLMYNLPNGVGRDEVINTASKEIFTQHKTGFLNKEDDIVSIPLLEKLVSIFSKGKSN